MPGLELTYRILAASENLAATDALALGLQVPDQSIRTRVIDGLKQRCPHRSAAAILAAWPLLSPIDHAQVKERADWLTDIIGQTLQSGGPLLSQAILAAGSLHLFDHVLLLTSIAESHVDRGIRKTAAATLLTLATELGMSAREGAPRNSVRRPFLNRLTDSVVRLDSHGNERLLECLLAACQWSDPELRRLIEAGDAVTERLLQCFKSSDHPAVVDLLAGYVSRRHLPEPLVGLMASRTDTLFQRSLLRHVTPDPGETIARNLIAIGCPVCCDVLPDSIHQVPIELRAAMVHVHVITQTPLLRRLPIAMEAFIVGGDGTLHALITALKRSTAPATDYWMEAAEKIATDDDDVISTDPKSTLLLGLVDVLCHREQRLVDAVHEFLAPLHAETMLPVLQEKQGKHRRIIGRLVMMIDPQAIQRVRDSLRHPVLQNRLNAISAADALGAVELLAPSMASIVHHDHQEARRRAAEVMGDADGSETLRLLRQMCHLPDNSVRDTAIESLRRRGHAVAVTGSDTVAVAVAEELVP